MPGLQLPRAAFEPISPDLDYTELVESTPNFEPVTRIHCDAIEEQGIESFQKLVQFHVIRAGKPLVVEGYGSRLEKWIFSPRWLKDNHGSKVEIARDLTQKSNVPLTIQHYLSSMPALTDQFNATNYKDPSRQRMYMKDIDCPPVWHEKLRSLLPPFLYYMNESVATGEGEVAPAGDLMSSLPDEMRALNMMCYIGHEGTYTPAHQEMCATLGHNIMVEASTGAVEDGKPTKPGSSIWFMTESNDLKVVSEYWLSTLGHDIEIEDHFAQINAWKSAPFKTWIVEQKVGDFILIPPLAPHQVWNRGTRTMKVAWNRTTVETLTRALNDALPRARMVCRDEQYKNKAIIYFSLKKYSNLLKKATAGQGLRYPSLIADFKRLFALYTQVLLSESFSTQLPEPKNVELVPFSRKFPDGEEDTYDVCMDCFVMGRSCACISKLKWVEQFRWKDLIRDHEHWRNQIATFAPHKKGKRDKDNFQPLAVEQEGYEKKTLAEICQVELKRRPWRDITKPIKDGVDDEGNRESDRKRRKISKAEKHKYSRCHICGPTLNWKLETCSQCNLQWCYGSLYRAFDIMPMSVLELRSWKCPRCEKMCPCASCKRRDPTIKGYVPTETRIGHDTKKIADIRSVESLVDFSHSNLFWLKKSGEHPEESQGSRRMQLRIEEAEKAKMDDPVLDDHDSDDGEMRVDGNQNNISNLDESLIDPALMDMGHQTGFVVPVNAVFREDMTDRYQPTEGITFEYPEPDLPNEHSTAQEPFVDSSLQPNGLVPEPAKDGDLDEDEPGDLPIDPSLEDNTIDDPIPALTFPVPGRLQQGGVNFIPYTPMNLKDLLAIRPSIKTVKGSTVTVSKSKAPQVAEKGSEGTQANHVNESMPATRQGPELVDPSLDMKSPAKLAAKNKAAKLQAMGRIEDDENDGWA
ncbi:hypothetical protein MferCBS31731_005399 [Microsporum ferrugineum]